MFNRYNYTYTQAQPQLAEMERYLAAYAEKVPECDNSYKEDCNIFIMGNRDYGTMQKKLAKNMQVLIYSGWVQEIPWSSTETAVIIPKQGAADGSTLTLSKSHVRLPQLSYLITLTPLDFFEFFSLLANQGTLLHFELAEDEIPPLFQTWFSRYYKGQRINSSIADRRWVPRYVIDTLAALDPTLENQLAAMQYITVMRDTSLVTIPSSTVIALELDWEQVKKDDGTDSDYCIAQPDSTSFVLLNQL